MFTRLTIVILAFIILTTTTKTRYILLAIESILNPLKKIKIPVDEIVLVLLIIFRFIPTLSAETNKILKAQASRGFDIKQANLMKKIRLLTSLFIPVFIISINRADQLANAMAVRGYIPTQKRTSVRTLEWKFMDTCFIVTMILAFVLIGWML